jgi:hypothetical protein
MAGKSDGYATGLIVFVLGQAGVPRGDAHLQRGRSWLLRNQNQSEGLWPGYSLVNRRDPSYGTGRFMNDAATAYAVLALTASGKIEIGVRGYFRGCRASDYNCSGCTSRGAVILIANKHVQHCN